MWGNDEAHNSIGVLGATGAVGTRFITLLHQHPLLTLTAVGASERSAGKKYSDTVRWKQAMPLPPEIGALTVRRCDPSEFADCEIIFSGLDSSIAWDLEIAFLTADFAVFSNAGSHRLRTRWIPLCVPPVNINHLDIIPTIRRQYRVKKGFLVCNSNCAVVGVVVPLVALATLGPVEDVSVVTMQAVSGAGFDPGVGSKLQYLHRLAVD